VSDKVASWAGNSPPVRVWLLWGSSVLLNVNFFWRERNPTSWTGQWFADRQTKTDLNPIIVLLLINLGVSFNLQRPTNIIAIRHGVPSTTSLYLYIYIYSSATQVEGNMNHTKTANEIHKGAVENNIPHLLHPFPRVFAKIQHRRCVLL
jgi:hypothetical protein